MFQQTLFPFLQKHFATFCCLLLLLLLTASVSEAQLQEKEKEPSIGELLEEAKIDADTLVKEVNVAVEKEEEKAEAPVKEPDSTPKPRLFKPRLNRPSFQKNLKNLQDQQKAESQLVKGPADQSEVVPPRKRFRPTAASATTASTPSSSSSASSSSESETTTTEPKPSKQRSSAQRSFVARWRNNAI